MIVLLGASGYIGQALVQAMQERGAAFTALSRKQIDYTQFELLLDYLERTKPSFLINAAGYTGKPNVDKCEEARAETLLGNTLLPQAIAHACLVTQTPWGHISSGCIYSGAKISDAKGLRNEKDLTRPDLAQLVEKSPQAIKGFTEEDPPNFTFRDPPCSFYSASKALGEEAITGPGQTYVWRLRIPFDEFDNSRNYLSKIQRYTKVYNNVNSISHRGDFVRACLDLWERRAPFGTYNVTNPGFISTRQVVDLITKILKPNRSFEFWKDDAEFYRIGAKTPRSNCVLDVSKILSTGVKLRPVLEALETSLKNWRPEKP